MQELFSRIDADISSRLSKARYYHSVCVAASARHLAEKYGADPEKAALAGIGHDVFKELSKNETFRFVKENGIELTEIELYAPKLWHAVTGSVYLKKTYGLSDDIISAVRYHTTGKSGMTLLEKILYTADFISADRNYNGVELMREKALVSLEEAMTEGLRFTVEELSVKCVPVHPDTISAYNEITLEKVKNG